MSGNLYITDNDLARLKSLAQFKPHALMFEFYQGADANNIITHFVQILKSEYKLNIIELKPETGKQKIAISAVRELKRQTRTSQPGQQLNLIIIDDASLLSTEAATAILKILEEPTPGVMFILGLKYGAEILSTIASRCYKFKLKKPGHRQISNNLQIEDYKLRSLMMLSGGRLEVLAKLVKDSEPEPGPNRDILEDAKKWVISKDRLEKLEITNKYSELNLTAELLLSIAGVYKSLIEHMLSRGDFKSATIIATRARQIDEIINDSSKLNLNKRVIQIKLNNIY
jgi:DNA polymerase III delta prime subunit